MRRTYVTNVEDKAGSFLRAAKVISANGGNIVRTSYNKSVDSNTMFLDVSADDDSVFESITEELSLLGFLTEDRDDNVLLLSLKIPDKAGAVIPVLEVLAHYEVNISYMNAQDNGTEFQHFKMGIHIDNPKITKAVLDRIAQLYEVTILDYDITDKVLDNTVFYLSFSSDMKELLSLDNEGSKEMIINSNKIMQILEDMGELPFTTFDYVRKFASFVRKNTGENFNPVYRTEYLGNLKLHMMEPPCGSTVYVLESGDSLLFVDGAFHCYAQNIMDFFAEKIDGFYTKSRLLYLTHSDVDHVGLMPYFDRILVTGSIYDDFKVEEEGGLRYRELNPIHAPYYRLSLLIAGYIPPGTKNLEIIGRKESDELYSNAGSFEFAGHSFKILEGNGGHVKGDTLLVCDDLDIVFTGDDYVNASGFSKEQAEFNSLAPYLMQSVNTDSAKAKICLKHILSNFKGYLVCPGHGPFLRFEE